MTILAENMDGAGFTGSHTTTGETPYLNIRADSGSAHAVAIMVCSPNDPLKRYGNARMGMTDKHATGLYMFEGDISEPLDFIPAGFVIKALVLFPGENLFIEII